MGRARGWSLAQLTPREWRGVIAVGLLYGAVVVPIGMHKGNDIVYEFQQSERWLAGSPLYESLPPQGMWWPPFSAGAVVPFALVARASEPAAKACWAVLGVVALMVSIVLARRWGGWPPVALGIAAVAMPLQNNFEHLNVNTVLLALVLAAAADLADGRDHRAGTWIGLATAIKAFPGLLLLWFALTRRWRALGTGVLVAGGLTYLTMLRYGPVDAFGLSWDWVTLSTAARSYAGAEVASLGMQKVARLMRALGGGAAATLVLHAGLLGAAGVALWRWRGRDRALWGAGLTLLTAVLIAPIGWLHSFTLAFPAWVAALSWRPALVGPARHLWTAALVAAGVLTSSLLAHLPFSGSLAFVPRHNDTAGSLLLALLLLSTPFLASDGQPEPA